jgi:hypothetical protein
VTPQDDRPDDLEEPALVRPYALVRGRTRGGDASGALPMEAVVVTEPGTNTTELLLERKAIVRLCTRPHSLAEVAALLDLPVGVARVLVADLAAEGFVQVNLPLDRTDGSVDRGLLERVLAGLEAL